VTGEADVAAARLISPGGAAPSALAAGASASFDGVLDNRAELARELGLAPDADGAAILLAGYRRWGESVAGRLRGAFAWVVADESERTILACRDQIGAWPLFYAQADGGIVFSSSIDALLDEPGVSRQVNRAALADHLLSRWPDSGETYYEHVRRVPPGHVLRHGQGGTPVLRRYWNPAPPDRKIEWLDRSEVGRFEEVMEQAVTRPLSVGAPGIFLSGGLDSVSVAAIAAAVGRKPLALSVEFPGDVNETRIQRGVATALGLEHVMLDFDEALNGKGVLESALEASASWPQPLANLWYPLYRTLTQRASAQGVEVVLTGGGGDEWLSVTPFLAADLLRRGNLVGLYRLWTMMHRSYSLSPRATLRSVLWTFGTRPLLVATASKHAPAALAGYRRRRREGMMPDWVAPDPELRRRLDERAEAASEPGYDQGFYLREGQISLDHALVSLELEEFHESGRRGGVAMRMPFWDPDLVEFLYRTPPDLLIEGGRSKSLVRQLLDRRFPELGFERHKKVLSTNLFAKIVIDEAQRLWRTTDGPFALEAAGVVDKTGLNSLVRGIFAGQEMREVSRFWNLLSLEAWLRPRITTGGG
jgi:asparagine synthase (glutamine-hydrolysing)